MVTGEEHARQALTAASTVATARTRVIQADHEVSKVRQLLGAAISGSTNELALDARDAIWQAERVLGETQTLLLRSAEEADAYVDMVAPGLRRGPSASATPMSGEDLLEPSTRRRRAGRLDELLRKSEDVENLADLAKDAKVHFKDLQPPPTKTGTSTSQGGPHAQSAPSTAAHVDGITAGVTSALLFAKAVQITVRRVRRRRSRGDGRRP
jgi:hypothetical protein